MKQDQTRGASVSQAPYSESSRGNRALSGIWRVRVHDSYPVLLSVLVFSLALVYGAGWSSLHDGGESVQAAPPARATLADGGKAAEKSAVAPPNIPEAGESKSEKSEILDLTFDAIKFDAKPGEPFERSQITPKIEELSGKRIRIRGWILPQSVFKRKGIKEFVLVRDNLECCFGPKAAIYDCIHVVMNRGTSCEFSDQAIAVEGDFKIEILEDPTDPTARPLAIYRMDAQSAKVP